MKRRSIIKGLGGLVAAPLLGHPVEPTKKPALRVAHLTDVHLKDDLGAPGKFVKCLHHIQDQTPKVDLLLNGGKNILLTFLAITLGTDESTPFFIGKIKLSATRQQIESYMQKTDYKAPDYYLFSGTISKADVKWAKRNNILTVGAVNAWSFKAQNVSEKAK